MKKKVVLLMAVILTAALIMTSCGSSADRGIGNSTAPQEEAGGYSGNTTDQAADASKEDQQPAGIRKLVKNVDTSVEVKDTKSSYDSIIKKAESMGGYLVSSDVSDYNDRKIYDISVRVPADKLQQFLDYLSSQGKVLRQNINTEDITDQYYDAQARLDNALLQEAQLKEIMKQAKTVEEILKVKQQLDPVQERIEQLKGQIKLWNQLTAMSLVNIDLQPTRETVAVSKYIDWNILSGGEMTIRIRNGFVSTLNFMVNLVLNIVIFIISALPAILIIALILYLIHRRRPFKLPHFRKNKKQE